MRGTRVLEGVRHLREIAEAAQGRPRIRLLRRSAVCDRLPHYGHLLAGTIKDVVPRYQTMRGNYVERSFGWDCHGLPVENEMEKVLKLQSKRDIEAYGVDKFNEACRSIVLRYTSEWETVVTRMGRWVDFRRGYRTMDRNFMESVWWVFKALWDKGLVYEGYKILPYCPRCATPLSNFETNQGYKEVVDPAITIRFKLRDEGEQLHPRVDHDAVDAAVEPCARGRSGGRLCEGQGRRRVFLSGRKTVSARITGRRRRLSGRGKGADLAGRRYEPLFNYFAELDAQGAFQVLAVISSASATAPASCTARRASARTTMRSARRRASGGLPDRCGVPLHGRNSGLRRRAVKETDKEIIQRLKDEGKLVRRDQIRHSYPHCWRDDGPLIYRTISTWFVRAEQLRDRMVKNNQSINWVPAHLRDGRFGKWLENAATGRSAATASGGRLLPDLAQSGRRGPRARAASRSLRS